MESRIWSIKRRHFQWPWTTLIPSFKVTPFFDAEYLINCTRYRHSFNRILIGTYTRPTQQCHFQWVFLSEFLPKITIFCNLWAVSPHILSHTMVKFATRVWTWDSQAKICKKIAEGDIILLLGKFIPKNTNFCDLDGYKTTFWKRQQRSLASGWEPRTMPNCVKIA